MLGLLSGVSVVWVVGLVLIGSIFPKENKLWELAANNLGDFLAGVFSPVAALWFVYAVFMQREELELQRQELIDTRKVLEEQQKAQEQSALSSRELTEQTKKQNYLQEIQISLDQYQYLIEKYYELCKQIEYIIIHTIDFI